MHYFIQILPDNQADGIAKGGKGVGEQPYPPLWTLPPFLPHPQDFFGEGSWHIVTLSVMHGLHAFLHYKNWSLAQQYKNILFEALNRTGIAPHPFPSSEKRLGLAIRHWSSTPINPGYPFLQKKMEKRILLWFCPVMLFTWIYCLWFYYRSYKRRHKSWDTFKTDEPSKTEASQILEMNYMSSEESLCDSEYDFGGNPEQNIKVRGRRKLWWERSSRLAALKRMLDLHFNESTAPFPLTFPGCFMTFMLLFSGVAIGQTRSPKWSFLGCSARLCLIRKSIVITSDKSQCLKVI